MKKILLKNIRYFTIFNELKDVKGGEIVEIQILKTGERDHPDY
jgi:hypothetical protein